MKVCCTSEGASKNTGDENILYQYQDKGECRKYCFLDIGKERGQILLCHVVFSTDKLIICIYSILKLSDSGVKKNEIENVRLISLDHVTSHI